MKERPITFSDSMVKAIVDGTKTQTRRVIKLPQPDAGLSWGCLSTDDLSVLEFTQVDADGDHADVEGFIPTRKFGVPGDQLWIREAWRPANPRYKDARIRDLRPRDKILYRATDPGDYR